MKKTAEKVALVAQICISFIFALICLLVVTGVIKITEEWLKGNSFVVVIMSVFAAAYLGLSVYMVYMHFAENAVLKNVLLYSDNESIVKATARVVKKTAVESGRLVEGVKVKGVQIRPDEKFGLKMRVVISIKADNAELCTDTLRAVLADSFKNILGLRFSAIDFKIVSMRSNYIPDVEKAKENAVAAEKERREAAAVPQTDTPPVASAADTETATAAETETAATAEPETAAATDFDEDSGAVENGTEDKRRNIKY